MSLWKRIKNLWALSAYQIPEIGQPISNFPIGTKVIQSLVRPPETAKIIPYNRRNPIQDLLQESE